MTGEGDSVTSTPVSGSSSGKGSSGHVIDPEEQVLRRLIPRYLPRGANHIYVSSNTDFKHQLFRGKSIVSSEDNFVVVHGLGTGIERAINLVQEIRNAIPTASVASCTSGFHVNEELALMLDGDQQTRSVPIIHMKLSRPAKQDDDRGYSEVKGTSGKAISSTD